VPASGVLCSACGSLEKIERMTMQRRDGIVCIRPFQEPNRKHAKIGILSPADVEARQRKLK
jgi:hypothetical protein